MSTGALFLVGTFMLTMLVDLPIVYGMVLAGLAYLFLFDAAPVAVAAQQFVTWTRTGAGMRLDPRARDAKWLPVDWSAIDRRRTSDLRRLDAMQRYAQTRYCRRAFVLRYFGDPEVRSQCAACDRCLGSTEVLPSASTKQPVRGRSRPL